MTITASRFFSTDPGQLTPEVEDRFFTALKTGNNTFKRTASDRFERLDERCAQRFRKTGTVLREVLDIGISSGATTLALSECLNRAGQNPRITGTDLSLTAYLLPVGGGMQVLVDEQGNPMQYEMFGRALRAWTRRADYFTGMIGVHGLLRMATRGAIRRQLERGDREGHAVRLLTPRLLRHPDISIEKNDIFQRTEHFESRFDFIRAANILNRGYFDEAALRLALTNVARYLAGPGAWLLVGRTSRSGTASTLFRVAPDGRRFVLVERSAGGSEIERLVLSTPVPPAAAAA
ncbi:hypothetical protein [Flavisphingomonas formosensis]|uniref:hypothetical protein n=1 Tax=Flavisphingomonas formosensis TaxID=861534 RepID=UPI0012F80DC9|nr:hypothetical protein [Sphingomonas formosensis]